jgi:hypothetical protein
LAAVLSNDLMDACGRADSNNLDNIAAYPAFMYNEMDSRSYGSRKAVKDWLDMHAAERAKAQGEKA